MERPASYNSRRNTQSGTHPGIIARAMMMAVWHLKPMAETAKSMTAETIEPADSRTIAGITHILAPNLSIKGIKSKGKKIEADFSANLHIIKKAAPMM